MPNQLICGDATRLETCPLDSIDLVVTSPPYNVGKAYNGDAAGDELDYSAYLDFTRQWVSNCLAWTRSTGRMCINVGLDINRGGKQPVCANITQIALEAGWKYHATIIWLENNISRRTAWGSWKSASAPHVIAPVEVIIVLYKDKWKRERQGDSDITGEEFKQWVLGTWQFNGESAKRIGHEAPFPRELPKRCIKLFTFRGDSVKSSTLKLLIGLRPNGKSAQAKSSGIRTGPFANCIKRDGLSKSVRACISTTLQHYPKRSWPHLPKSKNRPS